MVNKHDDTTPKVEMWTEQKNVLLIECWYLLTSVGGTENHSFCIRTIQWQLYKAAVTYDLISYPVAPNKIKFCSIYCI